MLEILVVVVIIMITISAAIFISKGTYQRTSVKKAARDIASLMRLARRQALTERIYYNLVFDCAREKCYLEKHYSGSDGIWEDIPITSRDERVDNTFEIDGSPGTEKRLGRAVDIDNINGDTANTQRIVFTPKGTVMGITNDAGATWDSLPDVYNVYLDDSREGTGNINYLVTLQGATAQAKVYSTWTP